MNNQKENLRQYEVRLATVTTETTTWLVRANNEAHAKKKIRSMKLNQLHAAQTDWDSSTDTYVEAELVAAGEMSHE